jgi:CBS domain-containing protein
MTRKVIAVHPETSLGAVSELLIENSVSGLPVTDAKGKVLGIVTEYDLVSKGSLVHIPTFMKLLKDFHLYRKDRSLIKDELQAILSLQVKDVMNKEPMTLHPETPIDQAVRVFSEHHRVNPILIVDVHNMIVGVLSRFDIMKLYTPGAAVYSVFKHNQSVDSRVDQFIREFQKQFILVQTFRTKFWFVISLTFLIVGFIAALFFALRIQFDIMFP